MHERTWCIGRVFSAEQNDKRVLGRRIVLRETGGGKDDAEGDEEKEEKYDDGRVDPKKERINGGV